MAFPSFFLMPTMTMLTSVSQPFSHSRLEVVLSIGFICVLLHRILRAMGRGRQALPFARRGSRNRWVAETSSTLLLRRPSLPATTHASSDGLWFLEGTAARRQGKAIVSRAIGIIFTFILTMDFAIGFETSSSWALDHPPAIGTARSKPRRLRHAHVERAWGSSTLAIGARTPSAASFRRRGGMTSSSWALPLHGRGRRIHPPPDDDGLAEDGDRVDDVS